MHARAVLAIALAGAGAAACTPKDETPGLKKYDGPVATALSAIAKNCQPFGTAEGQPVEKASDLRCISPDAEVTIHLDTSRRVRAVQIWLLAATTDEAHAVLEAAMKPIVDEHHLVNTLSHLDDPVPAGLAPIPQLELEGHLYQVASETVEGDARKRYIYKVRIF